MFIVKCISYYFIHIYYLLQLTIHNNCTCRPHTVNIKLFKSIFVLVCVFFAILWINRRIRSYTVSALSISADNRKFTERCVKIWFLNIITSVRENIFLTTIFFFDKITHDVCIIYLYTRKWMVLYIMDGNIGTQKSFLSSLENIFFFWETLHLLQKCNLQHIII